MQRVMRVTGTLLSIAIGIGLTSTSQAADSGGFYGGATAGFTMADISESDTNELVLFEFESAGFTVLDADANLDKSDFGFSALVGYQFGRYFALEGAYYDLGKATYDAAGTVFYPSAGVFDATTHLTAEASGPALSALGILPLADGWDIYGKAGVFFSDTKLKAEISVDTVSADDSFSKKSEDLLAAIGTSYHAGAHWTFRLEFQRFFDVGDKGTTGESDIDFINAGATFKF